MYVSAEEIESLMNGISGYELYAVSHSEFVDVFGEHTFVSIPVNYVNADYWNVFQFEFFGRTCVFTKNLSISRPLPW